MLLLGWSYFGVVFQLRGCFNNSGVALFPGWSFPGGRRGGLF